MPQSTALTASPPPCSSVPTRTTRASAPRAGSWGNNTGWNFSPGISGLCSRRGRSGPGSWDFICRNTADVSSVKRNGIKSAENKKPGRDSPAWFFIICRYSRLQPSSGPEFPPVQRRVYCTSRYSRSARWKRPPAPPPAHSPGSTGVFARRGLRRKLLRRRRNSLTAGQNNPSQKAQT